nr:immunoglobulin heavy chain junction region [Macaca mulatta]MOW23379.1 immunoglobulin heavy chain junction region [Macaca mulatta]MOW23882.1 immunoglobulin heavy chain junction region [Macaca mulatta]MOW23933.1 immunoglobulin heavy chain junction region [Macaca mulatta]MOW24000.1 immunoglobulin heavy chain junction region [Macaca mulatta]
CARLSKATGRFDSW